MKKLGMLLLGISMMLVGINYSLADEGDPLAAENFSATLTFTTDYAFRGTSFSDKDPAIQGSFDWGYGSWFAGAWGTSTNPNDDNGIGGTLEVDYYFGWADSVAGFDLMVMPLLYTFPGQKGDSARNDMTFELWTSVGRALDGLPGEPYVSLAFNYSPEYFDGSEEAFYFKPSIAFSLPYSIGLDFAYGYQDVGGASASANNRGNAFFADDYSHVEVGLTKAVLGFDVDLRYHDNFDADTLGTGFAFEDTFVATVSRSF